MTPLVLGSLANNAGSSILANSAGATGLEKMLGLDSVGVQGVVAKSLLGLSEGIQKSTQHKLAAINSTMKADMDRVNAQTERNMVSENKEAIRDAGIQKQQALQIQALQAKGKQNVINAATGVKGTSADEIKNAGDLSKNVMMQSLLDNNNSLYRNLNRQRQNIDFRMKRAEYLHAANQRAMKKNAKYSLINSVVGTTLSAIMGAKEAGLTADK